MTNKYHLITFAIDGNYTTTAIEGDPVEYFLHKENDRDVGIDGKPSSYTFAVLWSAPISKEQYLRYTKIKQKFAKLEKKYWKRVNPAPE